MRKVGGTAGLISALTLLKICKDVEVTIVRSTEIGHIMVGEGTVGSTPHFFHNVLDISPQEFHESVKPTFKLGVRFLWGSRPYFDYTFSAQLEQPCFPNSKTPLGYYFLDSDWQGISTVSELMSQNFLPADSKDNIIAKGVPKNSAYHFENHAFVEFLEKIFVQRGGILIDATVLNAKQNDQGIESLLLDNKQHLSADFFVDASGFRGELIHKQLEEPYVDMSDHLFCNKAVVGGWERQDEPIKPYTTAETMNAGWCWQIEHEHIINRGYVHCSQYISEDEAVAEFKRKNPRIGDVRIVPFETRRIRRSWVKNVVAIGNACGFVEPLEATNIQAICSQSSSFANAFVMGDDNDAFRHNHNQMIEKEWNNIRDFLALHYRFNDRLKTQFWEMCQNETPLGDLAEYVRFYQAAGPSALGFHTLPKVDLFSLEGSLVMLLGMKVPWETASRHASLSPEEIKILKFFKQGNLLSTMQGQSTEQLFSKMRSSEWQWE